MRGLNRCLVPATMVILLMSGTAFAQSALAPSKSATGNDVQATTDHSARTSVAAPQGTSFLTDVDQLVQLAQELKTEVAKTNKYTFSLKALQKAQEIEDLARKTQKQSAQN